jgi:hypothetical protein
MHYSVNGARLCGVTIFPLTPHTGLVGHLKSHAADMFRFYEILHARKTPLSDEEKATAQGTKKFTDRDGLLAFLAQCGVWGGS